MDMKDGSKQVAGLFDPSCLEFHPFIETYGYRSHSPQGLGGSSAGNSSGCPRVKTRPKVDGRHSSSRPSSSQSHRRSSFRYSNEAELSAAVPGCERHPVMGPSYVSMKSMTSVSPRLVPSYQTNFLCSNSSSSSNLGNLPDLDFEPLGETGFNKSAEFSRRIQARGGGVRGLHDMNSQTPHYQTVESEPSEAYRRNGHGLGNLDNVTHQRKYTVRSVSSLSNFSHLANLAPLAPTQRSKFKLKKPSRNGNVSLNGAIPSPARYVKSFGFNRNSPQPSQRANSTKIRNYRTMNSLDIDVKVQIPDRAKFESFESFFPSSLNSHSCLNFDDDLSFHKQSDEVKEDCGEKVEEDVFKEFEDWLLQNGAQFPDLYLKAYNDDVRGVHCKKFVDSYQTIVSIPQRCLITDHMGRTETHLGRRLFSSDCNLSTPNLVAVIVYILTTREDPNHFFQPYYKILPKSYTNFPIFWDQEKLAWLKGSPLLDDIVERKRNMKSDYEEICRVCPEFARYSFDEFLEVRTAVGSRNFGIVINGEKRTAMVPFSDMLNHFRPRETSWTFENSKNAFTITSITPLQPGQQVMDSYGKKCNSKFFLHYGFAVERNREEDGKCQNELLFKFSVRDSSVLFLNTTSSRSPVSQLPDYGDDTDHTKISADREQPVRGGDVETTLRRRETVADSTIGFGMKPRLSEKKMALLSSVFNLVVHGGLYVSKSFRLSMNYEDKSTSDALCFLRVKVATEIQLDRILSSDSRPKFSSSHGRRLNYPNYGHNMRHIPDFYFSRSKEAVVPVVCAENEANMLEKLAAYCSEQLKKYSHSYKENWNVLNSGKIKPFTDRRTALVVILGEQEICHFWIYAARVLCPILREFVDLAGTGEVAVVDKLRSLPKSSDRERDLFRYALYLADRLKD